MNDLQLTVTRCKANVAEAESRLREAEKDLEFGYQKSSAILEQAKAAHELEYAKLKEVVVRAENTLLTERAYLAKAESDFNLGFEQP